MGVANSLGDTPRTQSVFNKLGKQCEWNITKRKMQCKNRKWELSERGSFIAGNDIMPQ